MRHLYAAALVAAGLAGAPALADDIKIAHVYGKTGALEAYAKQSHTGFMMGLEYATDGTMEIDEFLDRTFELKKDGRRLSKVVDTTIMITTTLFNHGDSNKNS